MANISELQRVSIVRELGSSDCIWLQVSLEKGTFQDTTATIFNNLPKELKIGDNLNLFTSRLFKFLKNRAKACLQKFFKISLNFKSRLECFAIVHIK